jgi:hypothetical protein
VFSAGEDGEDGEDAENGENGEAGSGEEDWRDESYTCIENFAHVTFNSYTASLLLQNSDLNMYCVVADEK